MLVSYINHGNAGVISGYYNSFANNTPCHNVFKIIAKIGNLTSTIFHQRMLKAPTLPLVDIASVVNIGLEYTTNVFCFHYT
jgi:hypothetical protein